MDCPGEYLKRERVLRDVSLEDISKEIKVSVKMLRALEADDYPSMPHVTFVKGFIKAYCRYLGVDENDALLRYELYLQEVAEFETPIEKPVEMHVKERLFPVRRLLTFSLVALGIIIIVGIYFLSSSLEDAEVISSPKEVESLARKVVSSPAIDKGEEEGALLYKIEEEVRSAPVRSAGTVKEPVALVNPVKRGGSASLEPPQGEHVLSLRASQITWMRVEIDSGEPFELLMQPGDTLQWKGKVFFYS